MISNTLSGLMSTAGFNQPRCTCNRRHVSRDSGSLPWTFLILCCVTMIYGDSKNRLPRGFKDLQFLLTSPPKSKLGYCDLERHCDWNWNQTLSFTVVAASRHADSAYEFGPITDASESKQGHYLWFAGHGEAQMWSKEISHTRPHCGLEFWLHQVEMRDGIMSLVIQYSNNMSSVAENKHGNNHAIWEKVRFNLGAIFQPYRLFLEFLLPYKNSSIAVDNVRLVNCFPESEVVCTEDMFYCNNGSCLDRSRVCDFTKDCADGEDEAAECVKIPEDTRCNFENGWCGWTNTPGRPMNWTLRGSRLMAQAQRASPIYDHTYRNKTGTYAYVDMAQLSQSASKSYGDRATIESPLYNPTPPYSSNPKSLYYQSCQIRFFYYKDGLQNVPFTLYLVQIRPHGNYSLELWKSLSRVKPDVWLNEAVPLPNVKYRYFLQFEATRTYSPRTHIAIDDISLSPECFAIGVPPEVVGNFNYYNPIIDYGRIPVQHPSFENETDLVIRINTCGAIGRTGPTTEQCVQENNKTDIDLSISKENNTLISNINGVQRWTAPRGEYYTLIGVGARGGMGSGEIGSSQGALVRGVIELQKGDQLYFMIGQAGIDACPKNLGTTVNDCQLLDEPEESLEPNATTKKIDTAVKIRKIKNMEFKDGGGGGGGATSVFIIKANGEWEPILIAAGGGGLGLGRFTDDGLQHGRGPMPAGRSPPPVSNLSRNKGGSGANWAGQWNNGSDQGNITGMPLIYGGFGGIGCETKNNTHGNGGFGGGGGGCLTGGGGGGFFGGDTGYKEFGNGEGGYSYASQKLTDVYFKAGAHYGPGEVLIIPAISGCHCDYRCVALDQYMSETKCLCPQGWILSNDSKSCVMADDSKKHQTYIIPLIIVSIGLITIAGICLIFYKRYQNQKALLHRRQAMFGNGTELTALRNISDTIMTEFNPNYEFAGNLYSFKDLPQIPRDYISLVKPLGQGAFGEVFQGVCKYGCTEEHPVAVKALPSLSASQAETDFMMEALIMSKFNHPNIVHFIGVSFEKHPRYIVLELLAGGDLKNFLREERPRSDRSTSLSMLDLIMCGYDVANGCKYMEEARFIHRDIAARNCLLTEKGPGRIVKIADFGMARDIYRSDYYRKGGKAMLPIKWMPPESFLDGVFTTKTDVWAFGVLLWEIMSFGYIPYTGCTNREVMSMVTSGGRLEKPAGCPDPIYGIMTRCWHPQPDDRPSFSTIAERIGYCLQDPDVINHPTPNFDILPICDREITIMRPDPEAECINVQFDLDVCGYMRPKTIDPRSVARNLGQIVGNTIYNSENRKLNQEPRENSFVKSPEHEQKPIHCKPYDSNTSTVERTYSGDTDHNDDYHDNMSGDCEDRHRINRSNRQDRRVQQIPNNIKDCDDLRDADNGNSGLEDSHSNTNIDNTITDRRNGNESTTTTDTDSLIAQSSDTPPDTTMNSPPNTRTCSPNCTTGFNTNVNSMVKKNTLKATLSLDPSTLCRGTIPYEKIATQTQRSSTPGSMELRKNALSSGTKDTLKQPREEECSC